MENILNEPEKLIQIIENGNKKFFTSLLGKNSALYEDTNDIYIMQHLRTFLQEENFIRVFVHDLDKTVVKINMEIYKDRTGELLPLIKKRVSWEVSAFISQIYLPSSSGSPCPVFLFFNISTFLFQHFLY